MLNVSGLCHIELSHSSCIIRYMHVSSAIAFVPTQAFYNSSRTVLSPQTITICATMLDPLIVLLLGSLHVSQAHSQVGFAARQKVREPA